MTTNEQPCAFQPRITWLDKATRQGNHTFGSQCRPYEQQIPKRAMQLGVSVNPGSDWRIFISSNGTYPFMYVVVSLCANCIYTQCKTKYISKHACPDHNSLPSSQRKIPVTKVVPHTQFPYIMSNHFWEFDGPSSSSADNDDERASQSYPKGE